MPNTPQLIEDPMQFFKVPTLWTFYNIEMDLVAKEHLAGETEATAFIRGWNEHAKGAAENDLIVIAKDSDGTYYYTPLVDEDRAKLIVRPSTVDMFDEVAA